MFAEMIKIAEKIGRIKERNRCDAPKEVGDRVIVWDGSYATNEDTGEELMGISTVFDDPLIIIETDCDNIYEDSLFGKRSRDLLLYSEKHEMKVATRTEFVKLAETNKG